jgi:hypothetical protein
MKPSEFFSNEEKENIKKAVQEAELNTSGEIRVHIEKVMYWTERHTFLTSWKCKKPNSEMVFCSI